MTEPTVDGGSGNDRRRLFTRILRPKSSPGRFLRRAVEYSLLFGVAHLLGFRAYTSVLSGTGSGGVAQHLFGTAYLLLYAIFVIVVPTFVIAAGLLKGVELAGRAWRQPDSGRPASDGG